MCDISSNPTRGRGRPTISADGHPLSRYEIKKRYVEKLKTDPVKWRAYLDKCLKNTLNCKARRQARQNPEHSDASQSA